MAAQSPHKPESDEHVGGPAPAPAADLSQAVKDTWFREAGKPANESAANSKNFLAESVTRSEYEYIHSKRPDMTPAAIAAMKHDINQHGKSLDQAMLDALKNNRVLAYGDVHLKVSPHDEAFVSMLPRLKKAGATHLALEVPREDQWRLDRWNADDKKYFAFSYKGGEGYVHMVDVAKKAGLQTVAVDKFYWSNKEEVKGDPERDRTMATGIDNILKDKSARVVFFVGADHIKTGVRESSGGKSTAQLLREKGDTVSTFLPEIAAETFDLMPLTRDAKMPFSVPVDAVKGLGATHQNTRENLSRWDNLAVFPAASGIDEAVEEMKVTAQAPLTMLKKAVRDNDVVQMEEMDRDVLQEAGTAHRKFMASAMPSLKEAGATHLAIEVPADKQPILDQFNRTGKLDRFQLGSDYWKDDFQPVLLAAHKAGLTIVAVGAPGNTGKNGDTERKSISENVAAICKGNHKAKIVLWEDTNRATLGAQTVGQKLDVLQVKNTSIASLEYFSLAGEADLLTESVRKPVAFHSGGNAKFDFFKSAFGGPISWVDNVIVYPSHTVQGDMVIYDPKKQKK